MRTAWSCLCCLLLLAASGRAAQEPAPPPPWEPGLIVHGLEPDGAATRAGIQVGDVLLSYDGALLVFASSVDTALEKAQAAGKETVRVELRRGGETLSAELAAGPLGAEVRPPLPAATQAPYDRYLTTEDPAAKMEALQQAAEAAEAAGDARAAAWLWDRLCQTATEGSAEQRRGAEGATAQAARAGDARGEAAGWDAQGYCAYQRGDLAAAEDLYRRALAIWEEKAPGSLDLAMNLNNLGGVAWYRGDLEAAEGYYRRALAIFEEQAPGSLSAAIALNGLENLAYYQGDLEVAQSHYQRALAIREQLAPDSLAVAQSLANLGLVALDQGHLEVAQQHQQRALAIQERLAPGSLDVARSLHNLGTVACYQGALEAGKEYFERALSMRERLAPGSLDVADSLGNLGNLACIQGDLEGGKEYFERALAVQEQLAPGSYGVALILNNLGIVASELGNLDAAVELYRRALSIREQLVPGSLAVAESLHNLGNLAYEQGDLEMARGCYQRALAIQEQLAPGSLNVGTILISLGHVVGDQGNLEAAGDLYQRALAVHQQLAPNSLAVAASLQSLGCLSLDQGELEMAQGYYQRALAIREQLAPGSLVVADTLSNLGHLAYRQGALDEAAQCFRQSLAIARSQGGRQAVIASSQGLAVVLAVQRDVEGAAEAYRLCLETLEEWRGHVGTEAEQQAGLWARYSSPFADYAALLLTQGQPAAAFQVAERGKGRALLDALALGRRDRGLAAEEIRREADLEREVAIARRSLERLQQEPDADQAAIQERIAAAVNARQALEGFRQALYQRHPDLQAGRGELKPLTGEQATVLPLPAEVAVLSFLVGEQETLAFALRRPAAEQPVELTARRLPVKAEELAGAVRDARAALTGRRPGVEPLRRLSAMLLAPLADLLAPGQRLVLCPDGILWDVPWAALPLPGARRRSSRSTRSAWRRR